MGSDLKSSAAAQSAGPGGRPDNASRRRRPQDSQASATPTNLPAPVFAASQLPSHDEIARRAFAIYEAEGRPQGRAAEHWRRAEQQLFEQFAHKQPAPKFADGHPAATSGSTTAKAGERPTGWPLSAAYER